MKLVVIYAIIAFIITFGCVREYLNDPHAELMSSQVNNDCPTTEFIEQIYRSTVVVGRYDIITNQTVRIGSGWVVAQTPTTSYIVTAAHVVDNKDGFIIYYWAGIGQWNIIPAELVGSASDSVDTFGHDVAILSIPISIKSIKLANNSSFNIDDEVLIGGVQSDISPAYVTVGAIISASNKTNEFIINGWAWHGHSGGPVILRKTNEVIGLISRGTADNYNNASRTICPNHTLIRKLLNRLHLDVN